MTQKIAGEDTNTYILRALGEQAKTPKLLRKAVLLYFPLYIDTAMEQGAISSHFSIEVSEKKVDLIYDSLCIAFKKEKHAIEIWITVLPGDTGEFTGTECIWFDSIRSKTRRPLFTTWLMGQFFSTGNTICLMSTHSNP